MGTMADEQLKEVVQPRMTYSKTAAAAGVHKKQKRPRALGSSSAKDRQEDSKGEGEEGKSTGDESKEEGESSASTEDSEDEDEGVEEEGEGESD
eukprot:297470-Pelagomonas_calceolata.AAC.1